MSFLDQIFSRLEAAGEETLLTELYDPVSTRGVVNWGVGGRGLLKQIAQGRIFLRSKNLKRADRVALIAANSIGWIALDLAIMAEGLVAVPLYFRQAPSELVAMMKDCSPALICCSDPALRDAIVRNWPDAPVAALFDQIFAADKRYPENTRTGISPPHSLSDCDLVAIIYTSGTSGEAKGVMITAGNVEHILKCTSERLDILMNHRLGQDRVYQGAPLNFAAAWITVL